MTTITGPETLPRRRPVVRSAHGRTARCPPPQGDDPARYVAPAGGSSDRPDDWTLVFGSAGA